MPAVPLLLAPQFEDGSDLLTNALVLVLLVISLSVHEAAHAWAALKCGDTTARDLGRLTLNPLPHIDLFMTILLPAYMLYKAGFIFGGAKPVPVSFHRLRHPWRDMSFVALAGPASNLLLAAFFLLANHFFIRTGLYNGANPLEGARGSDLLPHVLKVAVGLNLLLTVFNLVPIPPLDGSRVMAYLLPSGAREMYSSIGQYGLLIVFGLALGWPPFSHFLLTTINDLYGFLRTVVTFGGAW